MESIFDPEYQQVNIESKILVAIERLSEALRTTLWKENEKYNLSPLQMRVMIFLYFHSRDKGTVSYLAEDFSLTKATISDAVKAIEKKGLISREKSKTDSRSHSIILTTKGKQLTKKISTFGEVIKVNIESVDESKKIVLLESLLEIIYNLQSAGIISISRMCFSCRYFSNDNKKGNPYFCNLLEKPLSKKELRTDCPEYEKSMLENIL